MNQLVFYDHMHVYIHYNDMMSAIWFIYWWSLTSPHLTRTLKHHGNVFRKYSTQTLSKAGSVLVGLMDADTLNIIEYTLWILKNIGFHIIFHIIIPYMAHHRTSLNRTNHGSQVMMRYRWSKGFAEVLPSVSFPPRRQGASGDSRIKSRYTYRFMW